MRHFALALALLLSTPSFGHHPAPVPPPAPVPAPVVAAAPAWLIWVGGLPIIGFAVKHYMATKDQDKK